jgi:peptidoglycan/LPS O-acetylase OafA/YrhL
MAFRSLLATWSTSRPVSAAGSARPHTSSAYRREIDGLRAIAVLSVILFHAGCPFLSGGFVGVDVFFVISGYLITGLILAERQAGRFSILKFYERRARRILPALFVMLALCTPFACAWMLPAALDDFSQTLAGVATFASNMVLWANSSYFNADNELKPLLHTWTLAVEEQYYWLFPLFLAVTWRWGLRKIRLALILAAVASLAIAQWGAYYAPTANFYLLPTRAWELLIGALLALYCFDGTLKQPTERNRHWLAQALSLTGVLLLGIALFTFDKYTPFPSLYALAPTVGAALLIYAATPNTWVGRILASRPFVGVGLVSYSAYLYHQPLFAFARLHTASELSLAMAASLSLMALVFAYFSWAYVENPCRSPAKFKTSTIWVLSLVGSLAFLILGVAGHVAHGFESRLTAKERAVNAFANYKPAKPYREGTCFLKLDQTYREFAPTCAAPERQGPKILLWGDSHAAALSSGLRTLLPDLAQYTASACPPLLGIELESRPQCKAINDFVLTQVARLQPTQVLLHADWLSYARQQGTRAVGRTVREIHRVAPKAQILIIGGVPKWIPTLPGLLLERHLTLESDAPLQNPFEKELHLADESLRHVARADDARFESAFDQLCSSKGCAVITSVTGSRALVTWDNGHLTQAGAVLLSQKLYNAGAFTLTTAE